VLVEALRQLDVAVTPAAASALADSAFRPYGASGAIREAYGALPSDEVEMRTALIRALGQLRGQGEIDFLVDIALSDAPAALKRAAVGALNDRLAEGIDVDLTQSDDAPPPTVGIDWTFLSRLGPAPRLVLQTSAGEVVIEMDPEAAPQTVQAITRAVREGEYDGVPFHRVVPNFVVQGGDTFRRDGYGGPEVPLRSEFSRLRYRTGTVGMASSGKDTEGVQFFVTHSAQPHLDGGYTVFGRVVDGMEVVDALRVGDVILSARVPPDLSTL
jgi:peptidylprolyl isomerase